MNKRSILAASIVLLVLISIGLFAMGCCSVVTKGPNVALWEQFLLQDPASKTSATLKTVPKVEGTLATEDPGLQILARDVLGIDIGVPASESTTQLTSIPDLTEKTPVELCRLHVFGTSVLEDHEGIQQLRIVPVELGRTAYLRKHTRALVMRQPPDRPYDVTLDDDDIKEFGMTALQLAEDPVDSEKSAAGRLLRFYFRMHIEGKFIDRNGRNYQKPTIIHTGEGLPSIDISGDELAAFAAIALEAVLDAAFRSPALYALDAKGNKDYFADGKVPTFVTLLGYDKELQPDAESESPGITKLEFQLVRFLSKYAGAQSQAIADLVVSVLKEANVELVFGANFAIGDSDSVRKLAESICEVSSRRFTEELACKALSRFEYKLDKGHVIPIPEDGGGVGPLIAFLLQEQHLIGEVLGVRASAD
jgi:hypothetical protein